MINRFIMYHASPAYNTDSILLCGLIPAEPFDRGNVWAPRVPAIYIANDIEKVKDYAMQAYEQGILKELSWCIFKIEYDEFPDEIHIDYEWGLPGIYYVTIPIPPEYLALLEIYQIPA